MKDCKPAEESTAEKLDSTDDFVGFDFNDPEFRKADMAAIDDELFEQDCARSSKDVYREVKHLEGYVLRGVRSVRHATIDSDSLNGLAHQAFTRTGDRNRIAWRLGRDWALSTLPSFSELRQQERRFCERNQRRQLREAKQAQTLYME